MFPHIITEQVMSSAMTEQKSIDSAIIVLSSIFSVSQISLQRPLIVTLIGLRCLVLCNTSMDLDNVV